MIVTGVLVIAAAYCLYRALRRWGTSAPVALLGVGILGVGIFPGNHLPEHQLFAMLAFTAGSVAAILSWRVQHGPLRCYSLLLGAAALLSLVVGVFFIGWPPAEGLGEGGVERWIAYPVVLWMVSFGTSLCCSSQLSLPGRPRAMCQLMIIPLCDMPEPVRASPAASPGTASCRTRWPAPGGGPASRSPAPAA